MAGGRRGGADGPADPYQRALGLLVRREHSRRDLMRKLAVRGVPTEDARDAVERLAGQGYQDDARFASAFARDRAAAGYGPVRIRAELGLHGLTGESIDAALADCEADWPERARQQVGRRARPEDLADPVRRRKLVEFLVRRGFDPETAWQAVRRGGDSAD